MLITNSLVKAGGSLVMDKFVIIIPFVYSGILIAGGMKTKKYN